MDKILIIGAAGQIGSELILALRKLYGNENLIGSDYKSIPSKNVMESGPFEFFDTTNKEDLYAVCKKYKINIIINMAAILSATGEKDPMLAWNVNINGLINVLEIAREMKMKQVLIPSSIAVFGPGTPLDKAPQDTVLKPRTIYGITKVAGELLGEYYVHKYGLDVRGLRYPGIISHETLPGGGTTDYAVEIFFHAIKYKKYTSFVNAQTRLPMMYMPDCIKATIDLMHADFAKLKRHCDYNVGAMSFSLEELANEIKKHIPEFEISYEPDYRQAIADSWPRDIDDSAARQEWGWQPEYDLPKMTEDMIKNIKLKMEKGLI